MTPDPNARSLCSGVIWAYKMGSLNEGNPIITCHFLIYRWILLVMNIEHEKRVFSKVHSLLHTKLSFL